MQVRCRRVGVIAVLFLMGAGLAGCGGGDEGDSSSPAPSATAPTNPDPVTTNPPPPAQPEPPPSSGPHPDPSEPVEPDPAPTPGPLPVNRAPSISGSPIRTAPAEVAYDFVPQVSDADADALSFRVELLPRWASFDVHTGRLSGTPRAEDAGTYSNIAISVSDGAAIASLPAFSITVTQNELGSAELSWIAPTENTDGSVLTNLAGYRIVFGSSPGALSQTVQLSNPGIVRYVVEGLNSGTWYFALKAYTTEGVESSMSDVGSKRID